MTLELDSHMGVIKLMDVNRQSMETLFSQIQHSHIKEKSEIDTNKKSKQNYIICMTARSGSNMLCSILKQTNILGMPREYLSPRGTIQECLNHYPASNIFEYFDYLRTQKVTPNGVFGLKTTYDDFRPLLINKLVSKLLNPVRFIYLDRGDTLLQAISNYRAKKTGLWHSKKDQAYSTSRNDLVDFDEKQILKIFNKLLLEKLEWEGFFSLYSITPLRITYEQLIENKEETLQIVVNFLGIDASNLSNIPESEYKKIGDDLNQEWAERIRMNHIL